MAAHTHGVMSALDLTAEKRAVTRADSSVRLTGTPGFSLWQNSMWRTTARAACSIACSSIQGGGVRVGEGGGKGEVSSQPGWGRAGAGKHFLLHNLPIAATAITTTMQVACRAEPAGDYLPGHTSYR